MTEFCINRASTFRPSSLRVSLLFALHGSDLTIWKHQGNPLRIKILLLSTTSQHDPNKSQQCFMGENKTKNASLFWYWPFDFPAHDFFYVIWLLEGGNEIVESLDNILTKPEITKSNHKKTQAKIMLKHNVCIERLSFQLQGSIAVRLKQGWTWSALLL